MADNTSLAHINQPIVLNFVAISGCPLADDFLCNPFDNLGATASRPGVIFIPTARCQRKDDNDHAATAKFLTKGDYATLAVLGVVNGPILGLLGNGYLPLRLGRHRYPCDVIPSFGF